MNKITDISKKDRIDILKDINSVILKETKIIENILSGTEESLLFEEIKILKKEFENLKEKESFEPILNLIKNLLLEYNSCFHWETIPLALIPKEDDKKMEKIEQYGYIEKVIKDEISKLEDLKENQERVYI